MLYYKYINDHVYEVRYSEGQEKQFAVNQI